MDQWFSGTHQPRSTAGFPSNLLTSICPLGTSQGREGCWGHLRATCEDAKGGSLHPLEKEQLWWVSGGQLLSLEAVGQSL